MTEIQSGWEGGALGEVKVEGGQGVRGFGGSGWGGMGKERRTRVESAKQVGGW